jgi:16S rRNA (guanine527-N7)-methyltransferase
MAGDLPREMARFEAEVSALGLGLSSRQLDHFRRYLMEIQEWNPRVRLVSRSDPETILWVHFLDSLTVVPFVDPSRELLDMGSGAGFPGLPVKIVLPDLALHLAEPHRRKAHFLNHIVRALDLRGVTVHQRRVQDSPPLGRFHTIVSRALASPSVWLPWARDLLEPDGRIILMLGPGFSLEEVSALSSAMGFGVSGHRELLLPVVGHRRRVAVLKKSGCFT